MNFECAVCEEKAMTLRRINDIDDQRRKSYHCASRATPLGTKHHKGLIGHRDYSSELPRARSI